jgi:hypothetical protein
MIATLRYAFPPRRASLQNDGCFDVSEALGLFPEDIVHGAMACMIITQPMLPDALLVHCDEWRVKRHPICCIPEGVSYCAGFY